MKRPVPCPGPLDLAYRLDQKETCDVHPKQSRYQLEFWSSGKPEELAKTLQRIAQALRSR